MKRIYLTIVFLAVLLIFNGCQKDHTQPHLEQTLAQSKEEITNLYQISSKYGLTRFTKKYGNLTPDYNAITRKRIDDQEIISLPLKMDYSTNVTLQLVMIKQDGKNYAQVSEFIAKLDKNRITTKSNSGINGANGTLNIYRVNGHFYKKYAVSDGKSLFVTDKPVKKAGGSATSNPNDDDDGDGVPNEQDKCPDTPAETWVDPEGCAVDNDLPEVEVPNPTNPGTPGDGGTNPNPDTPGDTGTPNDGSGGNTPPGSGSGGTGGTSYIYNFVENPCLSGMVDAILNSNITFKANETLQSIFGWSGHFNIRFMESTTLGNDVMGNAQATRILYDADGKITDMDVDVFLNVKNLPGASREYIAMVVAHESIHAYLNYQGYAYNTNQHDLMLSQYLDVIALYLVDNYNTPVQDAYSLAMGGLYQAFQNSVNNQTWAALEEKYKNKLPNLNDRSRIHADYETGYKGSKCN